MINHYRYKEIKVGHKEGFQVIVSEEKQDMFREITGDINPLHHDTDFAKKKGFAKPVVFGLLTSSFYSTLAGVYLPGENSLIHSINIKLVKPVLIGERLLVQGEVVEKNDTFQRITIKAEIKKLDGTKVSKAKMEVGILDGQE